MMNTYKKWLSFVLVDDNSFSELLTKIERSFKQRLFCEDDEGRYIATAKFDGFKIKVIDKIDRLSELLCDDNYTLEITIYAEEYFNSSFENYIKEILNSNGLQWERSVWAPTQPI